MKLGSLRKLILINSGVYAYAEIDLQGSVHLAGDNNVGKTSLISVFQFLYVVDWSPGGMRFSESNEETKKYYFKEHSFILIEVDTPSGVKVVGFRGLGPQGKEAYDRFVTSGPYEKEGFMDGDRVRDWEDIRQNHLALRVFKPQTKLILDRKELRNALTGSGDSAGVRLELVPATNYDTFVKLFLNLITLKRTRESDLKSMILDSIGAEIEMRSLDLSRDFELLSKGIQSHAYTLKLLEDVEPDARNLIRDHYLYEELVSSLPGEWAKLNEWTDKSIRSLREQAENLDATNEDSRQRVLDISIRLPDLRKQVEAHKRQTIEAETHIADLNRRAAAFVGLNGDVLLDKPRILTSLLTPLRGQQALQTNPGSRKEIADRIRVFEVERSRKETILANPEATWSARLLGECDEKQRSSIQRLIHPAILGLPEGPDGVVLKDEAKVFKTIADLDGRVKEGVYEDGGFRVNLRTISIPKTGIFDPIILQQEVESIQAEEMRLHGLIKQVTSYEALNREISSLELQLKEAQTQAVLYEEWRTLEEMRPDYERSMRESEARLALLESQYENQNAEIGEIKDRITEAETLANQKRQKVQELRKEAEGLRCLLNPDWELSDFDATEEIPDPESLRGLIEGYKARFIKANAQYERISMGLKLLQNTLGSMLPGCEPGEMVSTLLDQLDSIPERRKALLDEKTALVGQASRRFADFYKGFESVKAWVGKINRQLSEIQVSDLRSVEIRLFTTSQAAIIEGLVNAQTSPLFATDRVDEAVLKIVERMEEKRVFALEDLFGLHIKVIKANGEHKLYDKLDTESTGTAMTFKVVLMAMMLREVSKIRGNTRIRLPLFVDEADTLDDTNRTTILKIAEKLGFGVLMASPNAVPAHRVYFLHATQGQTWITSEDEHLLLERESDEDLEQRSEPAEAETDTLDLAVGMVNETPTH